MSIKLKLNIKEGRFGNSSFVCKGSLPHTMVIVAIYAFCACIGIASTSRQKCLSDLKTVNDAVQNAEDGDHICVKNGVYRDWMIEVKKDNIELRGEAGGKVILKGRSQIKIRGNRVTVKNFVFTAPMEEGNSRLLPPPIEFWYSAKFSAVIDCAVSNHSANTWVKVRGNNNQVYQCLFENKTAPELTKEGKEVALSNIVSVSDSGMFNNGVHHNKFSRYDPDAKIAKHKHGSAEAVYVKIARSRGRDKRDLGCSVHHNYFYKIDSEEETIGIKSSGNFVYQNAIEYCYGGISLRHGKNNIVKNNYILGRPDDSKLDYGINVHDENHLVADNWVMDVGQYHGIKVVGGNGPTDCDSCHVRAKNVRIFGNTLVNSALHLGKKYKTGGYSDPVNIRIRGTTSSTYKGKYAMITGYGLEEPKAFQGRPYTFSGINQFYGKKLAYGGVVENLKLYREQKIIRWSKKPKDLGDSGTRMIRKIECEAGPSWEKKKQECSGKD